MRSLSPKGSLTEFDPLDGSGNGGEVPTLGNLALCGERGALLISPGAMLRQTWNPFFDGMKDECLELTGLTASA